jgi:V/A-type H+-transporting ATPase subunit D
VGIADDVKPTRMELIEIKKKINLSERGHKLLKMKRDGLIMEFFEMMEDARAIQERLEQTYDDAEEKLHVAEAVEGRIPIKSASRALQGEPEIRLDTKNVMGVVVPEIEGESVRRPVTERGYGVIGTSPRIDEAAREFEELVEVIIEAAEIQTAMRRLLDEIEKTKRRVNALEFKVIPELKEAQEFIRLRLEEQEREELFRLKKIKEKKEQEEKEARRELRAAEAEGEAAAEAT